jgi:hypothetical protein
MSKSSTYIIETCGKIKASNEGIVIFGAHIKFSIMRWNQTKALENVSESSTRNIQVPRTWQSPETLHRPSSIERLLF